MTGKTLKIHTENILPIIKQWLYSDKEIFIRELISNACDALHKCKVLREHKEADISDEDLRIDIAVDKEQKTLSFSDTGIGMTAIEVEKYIAQIAFSGAEEFLGKYQSHAEKDQIIGHFGLGFYSAYMVAHKVTIDTLSYSPQAQAAFWSCDGSSEYTLDVGQRSQRGTLITLHVDKENEDFLEEGRLKTIIQRYCAFLPYPIFLNGKRLNDKAPLWLKNATECSEEEYLDFYRALYPGEPDPIFWIHLNVDYPFHLKGILYFPKITRRFDWGHNSIKLFCNRVFVADNCKDLIPDYLMILRGAIDSPDIPLNVSRSSLQMDKTVRQLSQHISKKVSDRLSSLYTSDRGAFLKTWPDIEMIIKLGVLQDDKFYERAKSFLIWKNLNEEWTTVEEYLERHKDSYKHKVFYTLEEQLNSPFLQLYKNKDIEVLCTSSLVDSPLLNFLEGKLDDVRFQRIDGALDDAILDSSREKTLLDAEGKTEAVKIADFVRSHMPASNIAVEAKSLSSDAVAAFVVLDESMRRMRETLALSQQPVPSHFQPKRTFVVNTNNKLIHTLFHLRDKDPDLAKDMLLHLYDLSLLSQKELDPAQLSPFIARANGVLEKMSGMLSP
ncbi:MAG TPA: molecular chaperone HtpG [Rhabdochlamydiaceae bacterium]|jgi:molecular chaperone HtpG